MIRKSQLILIFLLMGSMLLGLTVEAEEQPTDTLTVTLHKRLVAKDEGGVYQNTGKAQLVDGEPLPDVPFQVADVTDSYIRLLKQQKDATKAIQHLQGELTEKSPTEIIEQKRTNQNGIVTFYGLNKTVNGKNAVYAFVEVARPDQSASKERAAPIVLVTPVYQMTAEGKLTDIEQTEIHIYLKNSEAVPLVPETPKRPSQPKQSVHSLLPSTGQTKTLLSFIGMGLVFIAGFIWIEKKYS